MGSPYDTNVVPSCPVCKTPRHSRSVNHQQVMYTVHKEGCAIAAKKELMQRSAIKRCVVENCTNHNLGFKIEAIAEEMQHA